jgi:hypothetical protein
VLRLEGPDVVGRDLGVGVVLRLARDVDDDDRHDQLVDGTLSAVSPSAEKWNGASMCVPVCSTTDHFSMLNFCLS